VTFPLSVFCNQQISITELAKGPVVCDKKNGIFTSILTKFGEIAEIPYFF